MSAANDESLILFDSEGYLIDPEQWTTEIAALLAGRQGIVLTDDHWAVLRFMRRFYDEHRVAADARFVIRHMAGELGFGNGARKRLFELFPYGYVQQACKIAGMTRPRGWSTG